MSRSSELAAQRRAIRDAQSVWVQFHSADNSHRARISKQAALDAIRDDPTFTVIVWGDGTVDLAPRDDQAIES